MARNRVIPFGYCMKNGEITTEPKEVYAVAEIFREYLNGSSLLQIAKLMESENIRYTEDSDHWNKNMVKRIIENEKHLGTDKYPQIIDEDIFNQANEKRIRKANTLNLVCDDLQEIRKVTYCLECGEKLFRKTNGKGREYWNCGNPDCFKYEYRLTDQMIIGAVLTVLNTAIANSSLLEYGGEISVYSPTVDVIRQQNEINRMTDSAQIDFDRVKAEIFRLAELKYDCCTYNDSPQKTAEIKALLENHEQLNTLDIGLFKSCVNRILISHFCTIEVELINGVRIKNITEKDNLKAKLSNASFDLCGQCPQFAAQTVQNIEEVNNEHSIECNSNSCESADGNKP
ncbi:recombinase family protein [Ruminococcus sp.]|uniref:recombinase family protein n=1 Tax=Ruminococcus sp. TaxID=41978 RepID=UPI003FEE2982